MSVRQVWKRKTSTLKSSLPSKNNSPPFPPKVHLQSPSPPSYNTLRDQMIKQLHNISAILDSQTNPSNAYIHAPPLPPPQPIHHPSHAQVEFHSDFCHCPMDQPVNVTFKIHYNGVFMLGIPLSYVNGKLMKMRACSIDKIMFRHLCDILVAKFKSNFWSLFFCIPKLSLDMGLKLMDSDKDGYYDFEKTYGTVDVYIAHLPQNLLGYYFKNLEINGSDEEVTSKRSVHVKKDVNFIEYEEGFEHYLFEHYDKEVNMSDLGAKIGVLDKNVGEKCVVENVSVDNEGVVKKGIDEEIIARQKKLDKGRSVMSANQGKGVRKKRMARPRGNGVVN
ncbi:hypothetical protein Tco_0697294 [Tanacetum coccineum]